MFRISEFMNALAQAEHTGTYPHRPHRNPRGPVVIWNLIRRCNLTCKHCYALSADTDYAGELSTDEAIKVMGELKEAGVPALILSGGEPLMRPDIFQLAEHARQMKFYTGLSTNGTLIDEACADRIAANGDVANKVGTYLKALACHDNDIPFLVAAPHSTIDFDLPGGQDIRIERRDGEEFRLVHGLDAQLRTANVRQLPVSEAVDNPAFDVTPARLVSSLITERGLCPASREGLLALYPEQCLD